MVLTTSHGSFRCVAQQPTLNGARFDYPSARAIADHLVDRSKGLAWALVARALFAPKPFTLRMMGLNMLEQPKNGSHAIRFCVTTSSSYSYKAFVTTYHGVFLCSCVVFCCLDLSYLFDDALHRKFAHVPLPCSNLLVAKRAERWHDRGHGLFQPTKKAGEKRLQTWEWQQQCPVSQSQ